MEAMKISINARQIDGPWGGGIRFVRMLEEYLGDHGHTVVRTLEPNLDAILMVSPQRKAETASYCVDEVASYQRLFPQTAVVLRVNGSDYHGGYDSGVTRSILEAATLADHTVFVSRYLQQLYLRDGLDGSRPQSVIRTGADRRLFHPYNSAAWGAGEKLRLVTHHWSPGMMKGIDVYERLDWLLGKQPYSDLFEFTYIGRLPLGVELRHARVVPVLEGECLVNEIRKHHVHVTGSRHEAAGNHYIEAMQCGLPVLYISSGGTPEYCSAYGLPFNPADLEEKLLQLLTRYRALRQSVLGLNYHAVDMCEEYHQLFQRLVEGLQHEDRRVAWGDRISGRASLTVHRLRRIWREHRRRAA
jgi:glycosyltransferase involved in cell wall biosynthesis